MWSSSTTEGPARGPVYHGAQPILRRFGLAATVRAALAIYNTHAEVDLLAMLLHRLAARHTR